MACMEHVCNECSFQSFDNRVRGGPCPRCGGHLSSYWDEVPDPKDDGDDRDYEAADDDDEGDDG